MDESGEETPVSPSRLSKTPSWITLGFVLGVLFVLALRSDGDAPKPKPATAIPSPPVKLERPRVTDIEAVFADWGHHAVWHNDLTEVALWDTAKRSYSQFYEVLRSGDVYYFRSIDRLTHPVITQGMPRDCPLLFTQPEDAHPDGK